MKIDHLVVHVDEKYQKGETESIRRAGFPYEPKWGKGTRGFKASNIWIGREYFELIHLLKSDGGGWMPSWVRLYNKGHRGLVCLMLDVADIQQVVFDAEQKGLQVTSPEYLQYKWGFGLFTRTMPWMNSYFDFFQGVPMQIGLQQMKDKKSEEFMQQYMVPNARENGITGIQSVRIAGPFTDNDFEAIDKMFAVVTTHGAGKTVELQGGRQTLEFYRAEDMEVRVLASGNDTQYTGNCVTIENVVAEIT